MSQSLKCSLAVGTSNTVDTSLRYAPARLLLPAQQTSHGYTFAARLWLDLLPPRVCSNVQIPELEASHCQRIRTRAWQELLVAFQRMYDYNPEESKFERSINLEHEYAHFALQGSTRGELVDAHLL